MKVTLSKLSATGTDRSHWKLSCLALAPAIPPINISCSDLCGAYSIIAITDSIRLHFLCLSRGASIERKLVRNYVMRRTVAFLLR